HDVKASIYAAMLSSKYKVISHMHVNNANMSKVSLKSIIYRLSSFCYSHIFWVSSSAFNSYIFKDQLSSKSSILYNIIDKDDLLTRISLDSNTYIYDIVYVGRITYQKHPERLINLVKLIKNSFPNLKVAIVGTGDLMQRTRDLAEEEDLSDTIDFFGFMKNPTKILKTSKLLIMTSRFEGTPMVALEAMCLGVPIVSTPTDGMVDLIENGINGFLSDNDSDLAQGCLTIIKDDLFRKQLSQATIEKYNNYCNKDAYMEALSVIYNKCFNN
ncbi:MAG: glycosyltransferase, partial [Tannerellaceae bacterium]